MSRCVVPSDAVDRNKSRIFAVSDAAEYGGGVAVYARYLRTTGTYSCKLFWYRSYVLNGTVPSNELTSLKLATDFCVFIKSEVSLKKNYHFLDSPL